MTHTFAKMEVSEGTYDEIGAKLKEAGYDHALLDHGDHSFYVLDMNGIGLVREEVASPKQLPPLTDAMYHAVRGLELEFGRGEESCMGIINDEVLDDIWEAINTALRVQS